MEDLTKKGKTLKLIPGFTNEQVESFINELAKFHSISIKDRSWLNDINGLPPSNFLDEMKDIIKQLKNVRFSTAKDFFHQFPQFSCEKA